MNYQEIILQTSQASLEQLQEQLRTIGIEQLAIVDPRDVEELMERKKTYEWDYIDESVLKQATSGPSITFYVSEEEDVLSAIEGFAFSKVSVRIVNDQDWLHRWKEYFEPQPISDRFVVKPAWSEYDAADGVHVIDLDPGMAFGTGTHETTRLCLGLLERHITPASTVLDVGTGTGILAIAAAMSGCRQVLAVDIDPEAVRTARENVEKNGVQDIVCVRQGDLTEGLNVSVDVLVSNLMADLIIRFAPDVRKHLDNGGVYIAGGILYDRIEAVQAALECEGLHILSVEAEGEWCAVAARSQDQEPDR